MEITPDLLLQAYRIGVFPMGERRDDPKLYWLDPRLRAVLPLDGFHLPHRLARTIRAGRLAVSADTAFADTVRACAEPRPGHPESWINGPIVELYTELHRRGHAHSVECRLEGRLVGGLYGVSVGGVLYVVVIADCRSWRQPVGFSFDTCSLSMAQSICCTIWKY